MRVQFEKLPISLLLHVSTAVRVVSRSTRKQNERFEFSFYNEKKQQQHENQSTDFYMIHTHEFTFIMHIVWSSSQHLSFDFFFNTSAAKNQAIGSFGKHCYFHSLRFNVMIAIRTVYRYWFIGIYYLKYRIQYELHIDALN